jgi:hypothetical protein
MNKSPKRHWLLIVSLIGILLIVLTHEPVPDSHGGLRLPAGPNLIIASGLTDREKHDWHHLDEGSGFVPLSILEALPDLHSGRPFIEVLPRYGFIPDDHDHFKLPIGFTVGTLRDAPSDSPLIGSNCSACHSGQFNYRGNNMFIEGAPNMLNFEALLDDLVASIEAVSVSPEKFMKFMSDLVDAEHDHSMADEAFEMTLGALSFLKKLAADDSSEISAAMKETMSTAMHELFHSDDSHAEAGEQHQHVDGVGDGEAEHKEHAHEVISSIGKDISYFKRRVERLKRLRAALSNRTPSGPGRADSFNAIWDLLIQHDGAVPMDAPVSIPSLFHYADYINIHWDGNSDTVMGRDFAQAIALGADFNPKTLVTSVIPRNVVKIEMIAAKINPPKWPVEVLGVIDIEKAGRGDKLFALHCLSCHGQENVIPLEEVGTDPLRTVGFQQLSLNGESYAEILKGFGEALLEVSYKEHDFTAEEVAKIERVKKPTWRSTSGYNTRQLYGLWASPPYLHNASVPTVWDLLQPVSKRPKKFKVGRELDPVKLGMDGVNQPEGGWEFDVREKGNGNIGHEFGIDLSDEEKWDLIEFLKTI